MTISFILLLPHDETRSHNTHYLNTFVTATVELFLTEKRNMTGGLSSYILLDCHLKNLILALTAYHMPTFIVMLRSFVCLVKIFFRTVELKLV
jgi:hypothetical protein